MMKLLKNSASNIVNGSANAIFALILPPILIGRLDGDEFAVWSYVLQTGAIIGYLNLGVQTAVGRFVALYIEGREPDKILPIIRISYILMFCMFIIALTGVYFFSDKIKDIISISDPNLLYTMKSTFIMVSVGYASSLFMNVVFGYYVGLQKNHIPMNVNVISKIFLGLAVVYASSIGLYEMGVAFLTVNVFFAIVSIVTFKIIIVKRNFSKTQSEESKKFIKFCFGLSAWNIGMLLVNGFHGIIIGNYSMDYVAYFSISNGLIIAAAGLISTGLNPLIQIYTKMHAKNDIDKLSRNIVFTTRSICIVMLSMLLCYHIFGHYLVNIWLSSEYAAFVYPMINVLLVATSIRVLNIPYALALISTGNQNKALYGGIFEGVCNIIIGLYICKYIGVEYYVYSIVISSSLATIYNITINYKLSYNHIRLSLTSFISNEFIVLAIMILLSMTFSDCFIILASVYILYKISLAYKNKNLHNDYF